jgi:glycosyltransferase involved in cell wall biosynthesis
MVNAGLSDWKLVLIGGCDKANREYALQVRREAVGYPIEVRLNAGFDVLDDHVARASIYWHATGFGVNLDEFPDRAEHFGIAPVEAMSTGAIPIVYGLGGPREIVDFGRNGFFFTSEDELIAHTRHVIDMPEDQRSQIGRVASESAQRFSPDRFANELLEHVRGLLNRGMFDR